MKKKINDGYFLDYLHDGKSIFSMGIHDQNRQIEQRHSQDPRKHLRGRTLQHFWDPHYASAEIHHLESDIPWIFKIDLIMDVRSGLNWDVLWMFQLLPGQADVHRTSNRRSQDVSYPLDYVQRNLMLSTETKIRLYLRR